MTTLLSRPLSREVLLNGEAFKVVISPTGIRINRKGRRQAREVGWDTLLSLGEPPSRPSTTKLESQRSDLPEPVAVDVAKQIRLANAALTRVAELLTRAGDLPASVLNTLEPDPVYGHVEHHSDWFIKPLLTSGELASILRISKRSVSTLPIPSLLIGGERRFRQSAVRRFLSDLENSRYLFKSR